MKEIILVDENTCKIDNRKCKCNKLCWFCNKGKYLSKHGIKENKNIENLKK